MVSGRLWTAFVLIFVVAAFASPSGAGHLPKPPVLHVVSVELALGSQHVRVDGKALTNPRTGLASYGKSTALLREVFGIGRCVTFKSEQFRALYDYGWPKTVLISAVVGAPRSEGATACQPPATNVLLFIIGTPTIAVRTPYGVVRVGDLTEELPVRLRRAAKRVDNVFLFPLEDECARAKGRARAYPVTPSVARLRLVVGRGQVARIEITTGQVVPTCG